MSYSNIENEIEMWGMERGIIQHGKPMGQAIKTMEECTELLDAMNKVLSGMKSEDFTAMMDKAISVAPAI